MAHFGSGLWPAEYGVVKSASAVSVALRGAGVTGNVEGTDKFTHTVRSTGYYRVTCNMTLVTASDATTSVVSPAATYTNSGGSESAVAIQLGSTGLTLDCKGTLGTSRSWTGVFQVPTAASTLVVDFNNACTGTNTTKGTIAYCVVFEKIADLAATV
jgi:hypothetical protein